MLDTGNQHFNVTLSEITAPPAQTPLGARASASLASLCYGEAATLAITGTAEDGSTIGQVSCAGRDAAIRPEQPQFLRFPGANAG